MDELKVYFGILQAAGNRHDRRLVGRICNRLGGLRKKMSKELLAECLGVYAGTCPELNNLFNIQPQPNTSQSQPTEQAFAWLLAVKYLQDHQQLTVPTSRAVLQRVLSMNARELDPILARLVQAHVKTAARHHTPADIHHDLMQVLRASKLRHDRETETAAHNGLARVYLMTGQWEMMDRLFANSPFPLDASNHNQAARHHYYAARLAAVKLQYEAAYTAVEQALRKAPHHARPFKAVCNRLLVVVRLLLGDVPELTLLVSEQLPRDYYKLCKAVRNGDLSSFQQLLEPASPSLTTFQQDNLEGLILRLHQNVVKAGLKRIATAYSAISIKDIQRKLSLDTIDDAVMIVMKAVRDGVIAGSIQVANDHHHDEKVFKTTPENKTDAEKAALLHHRIAHCHTLIQEAVQSMRFPDTKPVAERSTMEQIEPDTHDLDELDDMVMMDEDFF